MGHGFCSRRSAAFLVVIAGLGACSSQSKDSGFDSQGPTLGDAGAGNVINGGSSSGDSPGLGNPTIPGLSDAAACATATAAATMKPLDIYVMLDQSLTMGGPVTGGTRWTAVTGALSTFVQQPSAAGIGVGIQYFGLPFDGCSAAVYAKPEVEITALPGGAASITASIAAHRPSGLTPTSAALQGAEDHAKAWSTAHPDHVTVVVLATDGEPDVCDDMSHINAIAATALAGTPSIPTFVIGVGTALTNLNGIAAAGGTKQAFLVDTAGSAGQQFLDALNQIRGTAVGCRYDIPLATVGTIDYGAVNVEYTGGDGTVTLIPNVSDASTCPATGLAWYYDNPSAPKAILFCDAACKTVGADVKAKTNVVFGCKTVGVK